MTLKSKQQITGFILVLGVACMAAGVGLFFGWPGALIGLGATLWAVSLASGKVIDDKIKDEARAERAKGKMP